MNVLKEQTFWLGAMSAFAIIFFGLFIGMAKGSVSFGEGSAPTRVADNGGYDNGGYDNAAPAAAPEIDVDPVSDADWVRGDKKADLTVIEYSDIDCPFCARFHTTMNEIITEFDGKVNWVYRDFPLEALHPEARGKAVAAECVGKLAGNDAYWKYLDALFADSAADISAEAVKLGVSAADLTSCQSDSSMNTLVQNDIESGSRAGASGTPYSVIIDGDGNTTVVNGAQPTQQVRATINGLLNN